MKEGLSIARSLSTNLESLGDISYLIILICGAVLFLIGSLFLKDTRIHAVFFGLLVAVTFFLVPVASKEIFSGQLAMSIFSSKTQLICILATLGLLLFPGFWKKPAEYYFLLLALLIGSLLMTISNHLLVVYLAVELTSTMSYILTGFRFKQESFEASFKYLLTGVVSSAIMLYGISLLYGTSGSLFLGPLTDPIELTGGVLFLIGILFKISVFPMHIWVPNTYQAAPIDLTAFLSTVPKLCGFVLLSNSLLAFSNALINDSVLVFSLVTLVIGTFAALSQTEAKRLLSYGAIAHSGFLLPLIATPGMSTDESFLFYAVVYVVMNIAIFHFVSLHERDGELSIDQLSGLGRFNPFLGACAVIILIALVGLPPTSGFSVKLVLFSEVWEGYKTSDSTILLIYFIIGILSTALALFYYLRIPVYYFLRSSELNIRIKTKHVLTSTFLALLLLWIFAQPQILDNFVLTTSKP